MACFRHKLVDNRYIFEFCLLKKTLNPNLLILKLIITLKILLLHRQMHIHNILQTIVFNTEKLSEILLEEGNFDLDNLEYPKIILLLSGQLIGGNMLSSKLYFNQMQNLYNTFGGSDVVRRFIERSIQDLQELEDSSSAENPENDESNETLETFSNVLKTIYLSDVVIILGEQRINLPLLAINLKSVQGWTLGTL